jgi:hypothetical protein
MVVRKAARMAGHLGIPIIGMVENMSYATCPQCGERIEVFGPSQALETAEKSGVPLLGRIPLDPDLSRRCDAGDVEVYENEAFNAVAEKVVERVPEKAATPDLG